MPIVTREELAALGGLDISPAQFSAVDRRARSMILTVYRGDIDAATGRRLAVIESVYTSITLRLLSNPTGARSISLGSASITTGGSDESISTPLALTPDERADLASLNGTRRPSFITLTDPIQPLRLPYVARES